MTKSKEIELGSIINSLEDYIIVFDKSKIIRFVSKKNKKLPIEIVAENIAVGQSLNENLRDKILIEVNNGIESISKNNSNYRFDYSTGHSKEKCWYTMSIAKLNQVGIEDLFLFVIRDISAKKSAEENYRLIFENSVMGIYKSTGGDGRHLSANKALAKVYGYNTPKELISTITNISQQLFVNPNRRKVLLQSLDRGDLVQGFESEIYKRDGSRIWISESAKAVRNDRGEIEFIVGTVKDITERKRTEDKLREAKDDWERTFDAIDDIILILNCELKIVRYNNKAQIELGVEKQNLDSIYCWDVFKCNQESCERCPAKISLVDNLSHQNEIENSSKGRTYLVTTSPKHDSNNTINGVVFVAKDITSEKKLRNEAEYRLQQVIQSDKLKSLGEMVAGIAHEINNPNSYIVYNTALLNESWQIFDPLLKSYLASHPDLHKDISYYQELISEMPELLESIRSGSQRIKNIVSNVKDFTKKEEDLNVQNIDINGVVEKALDIIGFKSRNLTKSFFINLDENIPEIKLNSQKLEQVIINLTLNSIQAVDIVKDSKIFISTKYIKRFNSIMIDVQDNGRGIKKEDIVKLFDPFFTTRRDIGGTGLGLSVSYDIIKEFNGKISVHSKENLGSRFMVFLPLGKSIILDLKPRILCVDDDETIPNHLRVSMLKEEFNFVDFIPEAANVFNYIEDHPEVDIILMNLSYGNFSLKLLDKIHKKYPLIYILLYSNEEIDQTRLQETSFSIITPPALIERINKKIAGLSRIAL